MILLFLAFTSFAEPIKSIQATKACDVNLNYQTSDGDLLTEKQVVLVVKTLADRHWRTIRDTKYYGPADPSYEFNLDFSLTKNYSAQLHRLISGQREIFLHFSKPDTWYGFERDEMLDFVYANIPFCSGP